MPHGNGSKWSITMSTPISIAVVLGMCGGAYWTGGTITLLNTQVTSNHEEIEHIKALTSEVAELAKQNKHRIEMLSALDAETRPVSEP